MHYTRFIELNILPLHASWVYIEGTRLTQAVSDRTMDRKHNCVDIYLWGTAVLKIFNDTGFENTL